MIKAIDGKFFIKTDNTEYIFRITKGGYAEHIYYGERLDTEDIEAIEDKITYIPGNSIAVDDVSRIICMESLKAEISTNGKGDVRETAVDIIHEDGSLTTDFVFDSYEILESKYDLEEAGLPASYSNDKKDMSLVVRFKDRNSEVVLELLYGAFEKTDIITRTSRLINKGTGSIYIQKLMSNQLDFDEFDAYDFTTFSGGWADEMHRIVRELKAGITETASFCGNSSSRNNPFCMISQKGATETYGDVYGFNFVYSGNHYESVYMDVYGRVRFMQGINPTGFRYKLAAGEIFTAPEAVMTYSEKGFEGMSHNMHSFVRNNIVRGKWQFKERPILINSWESFYFDFNENKLWGLAKNASKLGIELFVIDDGWFKNRNNDTSSLGDWVVDKKKMPHGLAAFADKLKKIDMKLGIWVEPEMVNENSDLFREHPEYAVRIPNKNHALGRNQMILDLTNQEVVDYVTEALRKLFSSAEMTYVKWDMNRVFSDTYSTTLDSDSQLEFSHRYVLGLYKILDTLTKEFPDILFESCSSGGNRFDLGMLCYMPQTWASDNTDAKCRVDIQTSYSYGYPVSTMGAHVSQSPNHQTLRTTPLNTRFEVAAFGALGYECDFDDFSSFELEQIKAQVEFYKKHRKTIQFGDFYRLLDDGNRVQWFAYDKQSGEGIVTFFHHHVLPGNAYDRIKFRGIEQGQTYHIENRPIQFSIKEFGTLVNIVSPVHVRMNSMLHNVLDKIKHMDSEKESHDASGKVLCKAGIKLSEAFSCRGYNDTIRFMPDNGTRMYVVSKKEDGADGQ